MCFENNNNNNNNNYNSEIITVKIFNHRKKTNTTQLGCDIFLPCNLLHDLVTVISKEWLHAKRRNTSVFFNYRKDHDFISESGCQPPYVPPGLKESGKTKNRWDMKGLEAEQLI